MTSTRLFRQIVTDTQKLLRLKLQFAQGNTFLKTEIDQLNQAISLKQALSDGLQPPSGDPHPWNVSKHQKQHGISLMDHKKKTAYATNA